MDDSPEILATLDRLIAAIEALNTTIQQIGGLSARTGPLPMIREQPLQPLMPPLVAQQWFRRDGDNFPKGT